MYAALMWDISSSSMTLLPPISETQIHTSNPLLNFPRLSLQLNIRRCISFSGSPFGYSGLKLACLAKYHGMCLQHPNAPNAAGLVHRVDDGVHACDRLQPQLQCLRVNTTQVVRTRPQRTL